MRSSEPEAHPAQRVAFAVAASLLLHALLLPPLDAGALRLKGLGSRGYVPLSASFRPVAKPAPAAQGASSSAGTPQISAAAWSLVSAFPTKPENAPRLAESHSQSALNDASAAVVTASPPLLLREDATPTIPLPPDAGRFGGYRASSELDVRPQPLVQIEPEFPSSAESTVSGRVVLLVLIGRDGKVDGVEVLTSEPSTEFGLNAKAAFERARFRPGEIQGRPEPSYLTIEVKFG